MSDLTIRRGTPDDAVFLAEIIHIAARAHVPRSWFEIALDHSEAESLEFLKHLTNTPTPSMWHHSRFLIGEEDGQPATAMCAFRAGETLPLSSAAITEAATMMGLSDDEQMRIWDRGAWFFPCVSNIPDEDCWVIESVATLPQFRQRGYSRVLLDRVLEIGREQGSTTTRVRLFLDNYVALRIYENAGYRIVDVRRNAEFEAICGSAGLCQLLKPL
jgi:GNAT superfamily N-acetyltransferase